MTIFGLTMMVKSYVEFLILKLKSPFRDTCKPARPIQPFWANFFARAAATLKGLVQFQNKKIRPLFIIFFKPNEF